MAADRGLKEVIFSPGRGRERVAHARRAIAPVVAKLVKRAVDAGVVRSDIATSDVPIINFMLTTVVELSRDVEPELYKRYLAIVLDGLRVKDGGSAAGRGAVSAGVPVGAGELAGQNLTPASSLPVEF